MTRHDLKETVLRLSDTVSLRVSVGVSGRRVVAVLRHTKPDSAGGGRRAGWEPRSYVWQLWPDKASGWPMTAAQETKFVAQLTASSKRFRRRIDAADTPVERADVTCLMNCLRTGMMWPELQTVTPGVQAWRLLIAYQYLDRLRTIAADAFTRMLDEPSVATFVQGREEAEVLMRTAVRAMLPLNSTPTDALLTERAAVVSARVEENRQLSSLIETMLTSSGVPQWERIEWGRALYDPYSPQLWNDPFYLPGRITDLVPSRVASLLGEQ